MNAHAVETRLNWLAGIIAAACLGYLVSRVFTGIDFTDEMQHYGELASLVETGRLFQVDLFLQQAMYMFLYPVFRLYYLAAGDWNHLVVAGRTFMLVAHVAAASLAYRRFASGSARYPGWAAASAVLAWIPFNIFSPYYNGLAGLLISLTLFAWSGERRGKTYLLVSALLVSMLCVTYPTLGGAVALLLVGDELFARRYGLAIRMAGLLAGFGSLWAAILWGMTVHLADIQDAVAFSKAFGVGQALSNPRHLLLLLVIIGVGVGLSCVRARQLAAGRLDARLVLLSGAVLFWWLAKQEGWFLVVLLYLGVLLMLLYLPAEAPERRQAARLGVFGLLMGTVGALTSSNGVVNVAIGLGAVMPYLIGFLLKGYATAGTLARAKRAPHPAHLALFFGMLLAANNALHPYRDEPFWKPGHSLAMVPAFGGIIASDEKRIAIEMVQRRLPSDAFPGNRSLLVVGPQPWVYFALQAEPRTPMLFMHYSGGEAATRIVAGRLSRLPKPGLILVMSQPPAEIMKALNSLVDSAYQCSTLASDGLAGSAGRSMEKYGLSQDMRVCRLRGQSE